MDKLLKNSLILVTGGGNGIGRAICKTLAKQGGSVAVADVDHNGVQETLSEMPDSSEHLPINMNVSSRESVNEAFDQIQKKYNSAPSMLVNCAGVVQMKTIDKHTDQDFQSIVDVNLKGVFIVTQTFLKRYKEQSIQKGSIVNLGSITGKVSTPYLSIYAATKAGVDSFSRTAAVENSRFGLRVNSIRPGLVDTNMTVGGPDELRKATIKAIPMRRTGTPEEISDLVCFLLSDRSSYITGASFDISGGFQ